MNGEITQLLQSANAGDCRALDALLPLIYRELHKLAHAQLQRNRDHTLNTTALVHETYLKLIGQDRLSWPDRRHFFAYAAKAMRTILLDNTRRRIALKRGGDAQASDEAIELLPQVGDRIDLIALDQALNELERISARLSEIVNLHVFAGLEFRDIAACLALTERTVFRDWRKARALLQGFLDGRPCAT